MTGEKPMLYGITYGYNGKDAPGAELTFGMLGAYAQDEYSITPNLKLTFNNPTQSSAGITTFMFSTS